ncbi:hypothetical protein BGZ65_008448 [Modicella reniformis]|uniref:Uncharacterized protein n=1 Tax=Modicella reniformis TaxID=1440133 RepID=A0A9P6SUW6_9FUNG|nr:hypothetical protein BGZ65_008448 [Modicella reniformis]
MTRALSTCYASCCGFTSPHSVSSGQGNLFKKQPQKGEPAAMTKTQWTGRIKAACDELSDLLLQGRPSTVGRVHDIVRLLKDLHHLKPIPPEKCPPGAKEESAKDGDHNLFADEVLLDMVPGLDDQDMEVIEDVAEEIVSGDSVKEPSRARFLLIKSAASWLDLRTFSALMYQNDNGPGLQDAIPHVTLRALALIAPLVLIANNVLRAAGYPQFTRQISPQVSPAALHGLHLGTTGMYEVLCGGGWDQFDIVDLRGRSLTSRDNVKGNERAVFGSFLDMNKIDKVCKAHGAVFLQQRSNDPERLFFIRCEKLAREIMIPKSNKMTAGQINNISHTQAFMQRRQRLLDEDKNEPVRHTLQRLSECGKELARATTVQEVEHAQETRRQARQPLREFESTKSAVRNRHTLRLRSERAWHKLGAAERRHIQQHGDKDRVGNQVSSSAPPVPAPQVGPSSDQPSTSSPSEPHLVQDHEDKGIGKVESPKLLALLYILSPK